MSSINQLVSELAHSVKQPDSVPVRRAMRLNIIHTRNELIRHSFGSHNYTDKGLQQRFKVSLINVNDGDITISGVSVPKIKRTKSKVPRPTRLTNNLPFHSVRTVGVTNPIEIPFVKEASSKYYKHLPGMCPVVTYDYINDYIYINTTNSSILDNVGKIVIESVFEYPEIVAATDSDGKVNEYAIDDDNEYFIPEDMITNLKTLVLKTFNIEVIRDTNVVASSNVVS